MMGSAPASVPDALSGLVAMLSSPAASAKKLQEIQAAQVEVDAQRAALLVERDANAEAAKAIAAEAEVLAAHRTRLFDGHEELEKAREDLTERLARVTEREDAAERALGEIEAARALLARDRDNQNASFKTFAADLDKRDAELRARRVSFDEDRTTLDEAIAHARAAKAEYDAKLAKLRDMVS